MGVEICVVGDKKMESHAAREPRFREFGVLATCCLLERAGALSIRGKCLTGVNCSESFAAADSDGAGTGCSDCRFQRGCPEFAWHPNGELPGGIT